MRPSATRVSETKPKAPETLHLSVSQEALRIQVIPAEVIETNLESAKQKIDST